MIAALLTRHCERSEATGSGLQVCSDFFCLLMKSLFITIIAVSFFAIGCKNKTSKKTQTSPKDSVAAVDPVADSLQKAKAIADSILFVHRKDSILMKMTQNILTSLKNRNYSAFANYIHPVDGIRFSPYAFVDTVNHLRFSRSAFIAQVNKADSDMKTWGEFDGTGDPIRMTLNNYMRRFVYDVDFVKPEKSSINEFIGMGNSLNNLQTVYKNSDFTESHFSGFDPKYGGMDWKTLRLVFKERNKRFYLVGIVHDEWTI